VRLAAASGFAYESALTMQGLVIRWLVSALALYLTSLIVRGIEIQGVFPLLFAAVTIGILNAVVRPFILLLTLPLNIVTLGLFTLVVNAGMLWMASKVVVGFNVHGFWSALGGWLLMSFFTFVINLLIGESGRIEIVRVREVVRF
jgi:putative membrane protein